MTSVNNQTTALHKDPAFHLAIAGALIFWLLLYLYFQPPTDLSWPLRDPLAYLYPVLLFPIIEELIFRGFVQEFVQKHVTSRRISALTYANLITSTLFVALHFINHPPLWAVGVFIPSLIFGFFKDRTGKLTAPMLLHIFYNGGYLLIFTVR